MTTLNPRTQTDDLPSASPASLLGFLLAAAAGAGIAVLVLPAYLPGLAVSLTGESPKAYWFLSRTTGFVAFGLLWLSMVFGLLMTGKLAQQWPGHLVAFELHNFVSVLALAFAAFHALVLLGDRYINYTLEQLLVPFGSQNYRPFEVGLGQLAFYVGLVVTATFYVRPIISQRAWRLIHYLSFGVFLIALWHGVRSGTDSTSTLAQTLYWVAGGSVLFLCAYRLLSRWVNKP